MEIKIITVGKIKEKYLNDGIAEYEASEPLLQTDILPGSG